MSKTRVRRPRVRLDVARRRTINEIMDELRVAVQESIESGSMLDVDVGTVALAIFAIPADRRLSITARAIRHLIDHGRFGYDGGGVS